MRELEIPFEQILPVMTMRGMVINKCQDIIAYLTSNFYGLDVEHEKDAIALALACEKFIKGE